MNGLTNQLCEQTRFGSRRIPTELSRVQSVLPGCYDIFVHTGGFFCGHYHSEVEVNGTSPSSAVAEIAWKYTSTALWAVALRQSGLLQSQAGYLEECPSVLTVISPLGPHANIMYLTFYTYTKYKLCVKSYLWINLILVKKDLISQNTATLQFNVLLACIIVT
jgi:hypothetical protein